MSKKLHAKDLRRDEVAEAVTHAADEAFTVASEHRRPVLIGAVALLVLVVAGILVAWRLDAAHSQAVDAYGQASTLWSEAEGGPLAPGATKPTWDAVADAMGKVADEHPGSATGRLARLQQGRALMKAFKPKDAADALQKFVDANPSHWAAPEALIALSAAREDAGDDAAAEAALKKLQDGHWRSWPQAGSDMAMARYLERHGRAADAKALYEKVTKDESAKDTSWAAEAKERLKDLGGSDETAGAATATTTAASP